MAAIVCVLRLVHTFHLRDGSASAWCDQQEQILAQHLAALRADDDDFASSARAFHSSGVLHGSAGGSGPAALRILRILGAYDALYWAVWALGCRNGERVPHPVRIAEQVEGTMLALPKRASAVRRVLCTDADAAAILGVRAAWLAAADGGGAWHPGECAMLRYIRSRWVEACGHVAAAAPPVDAADARVRAGLLRWQLIGRDACARHLAFAVPSASALAAVAATLPAGAPLRAGSVVEIGAGNGYWSKTIRRQLAKTPFAGPSATTTTATLPTRLVAEHAVRAFDTVPPPEWRQRANGRVGFGTADSLREREGGGGGDAHTLLLCMPSPGEPGIAEDVIRAFDGECVCYVGEWASGMTGTRDLHTELLATFELVSVVPLPCMPLTRIALHVLRRRPTATKAALKPPAAVAPGARCAACGGARALRACPWTRRFVVCSARCYSSARERHEAAIAWLLCGAVCTSRPAFEAFHAEANTFLDSASASDAAWLRLAQATPQPERELPD